MRKWLIVVAAWALAAAPAWTQADMVTRRWGKPAGVAAAEDGVALVTYDLSSLPKDARIIRADLRVQRTAPLAGNDDDALIDPVIHAQNGEGPAKAEGKPLAIRAPWYDRFDATEAVAGRTGAALSFFIKACPKIEPAGTMLDVSYESPGAAQPPVRVPPQVKDVQAFHRAGQTFVTFKEIEDLVRTDEIKWGQLRTIIDGMDKPRQVRYCVYRSDKPITASTLAQAELLAQVAPLSCWNVNGRGVDAPIDEMLARQEVLMHGQGNPFVAASVEGKFGTDCPIERLVVSDPGAPGLARGAGLYVHTPDKPGKAYYAVITSIDGVQNTAELSGVATGPIDETASGGHGQPVLQKVFPPKPYFNYRETRLHYVTWVAPPFTNLPSQ